MADLYIQWWKQQLLELSPPPFSGERSISGDFSEGMNEGQVLPLFLKQSDPQFAGKCHPGGFLFLVSDRGLGRCQRGDPCPLCSVLWRLGCKPSCLRSPAAKLRFPTWATVLNLLTYLPINYWYNVALFRLVSADGYIISRQTFARQADR